MAATRRLSQSGNQLTAIEEIQLYLPESRAKVAKKRRLGFNRQSTDLAAPLVDFENGFHHVVDVALCVDAPRNGEPQQFVVCVRAEHHRADLDRADSGVAIQLDGQSLSRKLRLRNVAQHSPGIDI